MWLIGGMLTAAVTTVVAWKLGGASLANASWTPTVISLYAVVGVAAASSFVAGSAICRRAAHTREHLCVFSSLSGGVVGGLIGAAYAVTLTVAYMASYTTWPDDRVDQVLIVLSYPAFGGLGFCLGAGAGLMLGLVAGLFLTLAPIRRRADRIF